MALTPALLCLLVMLLTNTDESMDREHPFWWEAETMRCCDEKNTTRAERQKN